MSRLLLSTAYLPNIQYINALACADHASVEQWETYPKQTYRNRCEIATANGKMTLTVPVVKGNTKQLTRDVRISYDEPWQPRHWHAIASAYGSSPYFMYYRDDFEPFYRTKTEYLLDLNMKMLEAVMSILGMKATVSLTDGYVRQTDDGTEDLREAISPKVAQRPGERHYSAKPYPQVFDFKMDFIPNLSVIDLIFNNGHLD